MNNRLRTKLIQTAFQSHPTYIVHLAVHILDSYIALHPTANMLKSLEASLNLAYMTTDRSMDQTKHMTQIYKALGYSICFETVIEHLLADYSGQGIDIANELLISYEYRKYNPKQLASLIVNGLIKPVPTNTITLYSYQSSPIIDPDLYEIEYVDEGTFGVVMTGNYDDEELILKYIPSKYFDPNEIGLLSQLDHPHIVKYLGAHICNKRTVIAMERLQTKLSLCDTTKWSFKFKCNVACQLLSALTHLHDRQIMHRDLTTKNVMMIKNTLKIIDFGTAIRYVKGHEYDLRVCAEYCRAPEIFHGICTYDLAIDVWSAGCIIWYIFQGYNIFQSDADTLDTIYYVLSMPEYFESLDWRVKDVLLMMLHPEPTQRTTSHRAYESFIKIENDTYSI